MVTQKKKKKIVKWENGNKKEKENRKIAKWENSNTQKKREKERNREIGKLINSKMVT